MVTLECPEWHRVQDSSEVSGLCCIHSVTWGWRVSAAQLYRCSSSWSCSDVQHELLTVFSAGAFWGAHSTGWGGGWLFMHLVWHLPPRASLHSDALRFCCSKWFLFLGTKGLSLSVLIYFLKLLLGNLALMCSIPFYFCIRKLYLISCSAESSWLGTHW